MVPESDAPKESARRRLVVIDGANTVYRAFFAIPNLRAPDGFPTNALHGFENMLGKVIREQSPDFIVVAFDPRGGSFRNELYPEYKAGRDAQPEDLSAQLPVLRELIEAHGIRLIEVEGFEADDVVATLVAEAPDDVEVSIVSTDKDLMQLVSDRVALLDTMKDRRIGPAEVEERFGVTPDKLLDVRALVGDSSDNIPGVKGIGEKGAAKLIGEWGSLEALLEHARDVKAKRAREALLEHRDDAILSKELSTLRSDVDLPCSLEDLALPPADAEKLRPLYERLGFTRLLAALDDDGGGPKTAESDAAPVEIDRCASADALRACLEEASAGGAATMFLLETGGSVIASQPVGLALALGEGRAAYVPIGGLGAAAGPGAHAVAAELESFFAADDRRWCAGDAKRLAAWLQSLGIEPDVPVGDLSVAAFLSDPAGSHAVDALAASLLPGRKVQSLEEVAGRGAKAIATDALPLDVAERFAAEQVVAIDALIGRMQARLEEHGLDDLYRDVELPLTTVLARVERNGVRVDEDKLAALGKEYGELLATFEREIYDLAGEEFLISSPKQLQVILFEKLNLPPLKKTKTGYSTAESVLEQLKLHHPLPGRILDYRKLAKLMSTYIDALPPLVDERTGRVHPQFNQNGAATGRMSATHPNVQNIPIRGEEGARIREAFVPAEGHELISADYSQVELRILAHYSGDQSLQDAFRSGEDIHSRTAAEVAGIAIEDVDAELRARAKAVNFGIIYGSSAFGLANQLGIATGEAQETIDAYFTRYEGVRRFIDETISEARERGYVTTALGRRRYLPDLASRNRVLKQAAERMAVNTVIQGTAADLIKAAMVKIDRIARAQALDLTMILQVHDELVFEIDPTEFDAHSALLQHEMTHAIEFSVPLVVDVGRGRNWREAH